MVVPAAAGWWWFAVTQWWNGGTKDTTVRRKRVVMGRESRCVLLLVALAVLAAADAFSTDSKSALLCEKREATFADGDSERKGCARMEGKGRGAGESWSRSLARIHPAASRSSVGIRDFSRVRFWRSSPGRYRDVSTNLSVMTSLACTPLPFPSRREARRWEIDVALSFIRG